MDKEINKELNSFRGFTLIELLAVIVVLAIIILIAVNAVLPQMERARRSSFAIEANAAIDSASGYFMSAGLTGSDNGLPSANGGTACVEIEDLILGGYSELDNSEYEGKVVVTKGSDLTGQESVSTEYRNDYSNVYFYEVWIKKGDSMVILGERVTKSGTYPVANVSIGEGDVEGLTDTNWQDDYKTCP